MGQINLFPVALIVVLLPVAIYVIVLLGRIVKAVEKIARKVDEFKSK
jgi:hypothetical protein